MGRLLVSGLIAASVLPAGLAQATPKTDGSVPAPAHVVRLVTHVPASTLNKVGAGDVASQPGFRVFKLSSQLSRNGKPELLTMNLAWCPHCAANSWAVAVALSRFGKLTGLRVIDTGSHFCKVAHGSCNLKPVPCYPHTHGLSFFGARYHSPFLSLAAIVIQDVRGHNLERPTPTEFAALNQFDPVGQAPAVDIGGGYGLLGPGYDPGALAHKSWSQIAGSLADPLNPIARRIDGLANLFTAAVCRVTNGRPRGICTAPGVLAAGAARLDTAGSPPSGPGP